MKKKLAAVALAVALVSLAVPALAFAGGYGQAADGARQARGACFALCQATEALGGSMADLATTAAAHCGRAGLPTARTTALRGPAAQPPATGQHVDADGDGVCARRRRSAASGDGAQGSCPGVCGCRRSTASATPAATLRVQRGGDAHQHARAACATATVRAAAGSGLRPRPWHGPRVRLPALARPLSEREVRRLPHAGVRGHSECARGAWQRRLACLRPRFPFVSRCRRTPIQETFRKHALAEDARFNDEEHRKARLIRVADQRAQGHAEGGEPPMRPARRRRARRQPGRTRPPLSARIVARATWWTSCTRFPTLPAPRSICPCTKGIPLPR